MSFRRELYVPNGGPDGGDGGKGGNIIFEVDDGLNTLVDFRHVRKYVAQSGEEGGKRRCHGADGKDLIVKVPEGTVVKDLESGKVITDMSGDNRREIILKGGRGGLGNMHFATSTMQVPKYAQPGQPGQELWIQLELKVIADVGLVGFPNVGKSTLLSRVSNARPKIANYHFTTLNPHLGVVNLGDGNSFVMADIPGLIEGASDGAGLGHEFLRHIERTKVLLHVVDAASVEGRDPVEDIHTIMNELSTYNPELLKLPQVIAANKLDALYDEEHDPLKALKLNRREFPYSVFRLSAERASTNFWAICSRSSGLWTGLPEYLKKSLKLNIRRTGICLTQWSVLTMERSLWKVPGSRRCWATPIWTQRRASTSSRNS